MKQEAAACSGKRHDVRSIIASSPRSYHAPSHMERGRYDEAQKGRPSSVVSTASTITRSSPLTLGSEQGGKAHHSPVGYEDKGGLRNPYPGPSHRASPLSREASQRQHEGAYGANRSCVYMRTFLQSDPELGLIVNSKATVCMNTEK